jgi:hypothetical protein
MSHPHCDVRSAFSAAFDEANQNHFLPRATVRCAHRAVFPTQLSRDLGCLLDVDDDILACSCLPAQFEAMRER